MEKKNIIYFLIGVLFGGIGVWVFTTQTIYTNNFGMMRIMGFDRPRGDESYMSNRGSESLDSHFIEEMIPHHEGAIAMAKAAQEKAVSTEIRALSENIIVSQTNEIKQMREWYKKWFGEDVPEEESFGMEMGMGMMNDEIDIEKLEQAEAFDREFVREMIPHHQMAVMMATMLKGGTQRPEMKKLADDIIATQTKEINLMRQWIAEWESYDNR